MRHEQENDLGAFMRWATKGYLYREEERKRHEKARALRDAIPNEAAHVLGVLHVNELRDPSDRVYPVYGFFIPLWASRRLRCIVDIVYPDEAPTLATARRKYFRMTRTDFPNGYFEVAPFDRGALQGVVDLLKKIR